MNARTRLRPQAKNFPQAMRQFLTPQLFKQVRIHDHRRRRKPRWDTHPLIWVMLLMAWSAGDSLQPNFNDWLVSWLAPSLCHAYNICMMTQMRKRKHQRRNAAGCCADIGELMQPSFFKALSDPNRIAILAKLATCCSACTVSEIADCCPVNVSVVSRHLAMLRDAGILAARKEGKQVYYSVRYAALADSLRQIADGIEACCPVESRVAKKTGRVKQP